MRGWYAAGIALLLGLLILTPRLIPPAAPVEISLADPVLAASNLAARYTPRSLSWSPDGRYIAIVGQDPLGAEVYVVDTGTWKIVGVAPAASDAPPTASWTADSQLWVSTNVGWDFFRPPFSEREGYLRRAQPPPTLDGEETLWAIYPDGPLVAAATVGIERHRRPNSSTRQQKQCLTLWRGNVRLWETSIMPRQSGFRRVVSWLAFSPDGKQLAFTVSGRVGIETSGSDELWLLDTATGQARFLHSGKHDWQLFDNHVQDAEGSWSTDSQTIIFGDSAFGVERIEVGSGHRNQLLPREWGNRPTAGREWSVYEMENWKSPNLPDLAVVSRDGKWWGRWPQQAPDWSPEALAWDASGRKLAVVGPTLGDSGASLWLWEVAKR